MKINKEALDTIEPSSLDTYLRSRGWREREKLGEFAFSFLPPVSREHSEERELLLLLDRSFGDYYTRLAEVLRELENYEQRPWQDILLDIRATNTNTIRFVEPSINKGEGTTFNKILQEARRLSRAEQLWLIHSLAGELAKTENDGEALQKKRAIRRLSAHDLIKGLEMFGTEFHSIAVFADDIQELRDWSETQPPSPTLMPLDSEGKFFLVEADEQTYRLELFSEAGTARFSRWTGSMPPQPQTHEMAAIRDALQIAEEKKGKGIPLVILGLLIGKPLGDPKAPVGWLVLTLEFDLEERTWVGYSGGLVPWMKASLLPQNPLP
jgi:hypothetical protein